MKYALLAAAVAAPACGGDGMATSSASDSDNASSSDSENGGSTAASEDSNNTNPTTGDVPTGGSNSDSVGMTTSGTTGPDPTVTDPSTSTTDPSTDPSTTTTGSPGVCGDGNVDNGEACDDGTNDGSYGGCMPDCSALGPNCGDGAVNGPEVCDDGVNDGSYDGCAADCAALGPFCGDGNMDGPEACDDGNQVDDDACTNACAAAVCGDGIVQMGAGEVCDDGVNDGSYGGCAVDCAALGPSCGDGNVDMGNETCDDQNGDNTDGCLANCAIPANCAEILAFDPAAMDGVHGLGVGGTNWRAYCDMTTDGGGWTLAAKLGNTDGWAYQSPRWTDNMTFNANMPDYDHVQAKLATWNLVPFTQILLGMESPIGMMNPPPAPVYLTFDQANNSLFELFNPGTYVATTQTRANWLTYVPMNSLQPNCNQEGFNNAPNGNMATRVRIGILGNNQNDCTSPDSAVGFGFGGFMCQNNPFISIGNLDCLSNPPTKRSGFGWLFVR